MSCLVEERIRRLEADLESLREALRRTEERLRIRYSLSDAAYRAYLREEIKRIEEELERLRVPKWELVSTVIVVYSITEAPPPTPYKRRFQGFYNVDALRDARTGRFKYDADLTKKEIKECIADFMARFGWVTVPKNTSEPIWIETSEFRFIDSPEGVIVKTLSVIEDEEETYFSALYEVIYEPTDDEKREMMRYVS